MRYRALSSTGDYTWGQNAANFLVNSPEAVAQLVLTRLRLLQGEWFLDKTAGTPYSTQVLGKTSANQRNAAIRRVVLTTQGVLSILSFSTAVVNRKLSMVIGINTIYGTTEVVLPL